MVKIGHAFSDFVSFEDIPKKRKGSIHGSSYFNLLPLVLLIFLSGIVLLRLFYIQVLRNNFYKKLSDANRTFQKNIPAARGVILDRKGRPLIANSPGFKIVESKNGKENVVLLEKDEALERISRGEKIENDILRNYLYKDVFSHVLGYTGPISSDEVMLPDFSDYSISDFVGKMGLEKIYETILHGQNGKELFEVNNQGKIIRSLGKVEPKDGKNLTTTLNLDLQLSAAKALEKVTKGAVVVSDPRNGEILAIFSKPSFDPNIFTHTSSYAAVGEYKTAEQVLSDNANQPLLDRAISGVFPPGSTFKLTTAMAALETGAIKKDTTFEDSGILKVGAFSFGNWYYLQYGKKEGNLDVIRAIKRSNDIFFYRVAGETGVDTISSWAKKFGFGKRLGIDLLGEAPGSVPTVEWKEKVIGQKWYLGDTYNYGIGQGYLLATPLQINFMTSLFANGAVLYKPHIVGKKEILGRNFYRQENANLVREGMRQSCEEGGVAWPFFDFKVKNPNLIIDNKDYFEQASGSAKFTRIKLGCKTGTAETGGKETKPHAWITLFAPFYKPEIVVTVLVENGGEGSSIAGPVARDILKVYFEGK